MEKQAGVARQKEGFDFLIYALEHFRQSNEALAKVRSWKIDNHRCGVRCFFGKCPLPKMQDEKFRAEEKIMHCGLVEKHTKDRNFLSALIELTWFLTRNTLPDR